MLISIRNKKKKDEVEILDYSNGKISTKYTLVMFQDGERFVPRKFRKMENEKETILMPKESIKLLRRDTIYVSKDHFTEDILTLFINMLNSYGAKFEYISLCKFCLIDNRINTKGTPYTYHSEPICEICAKAEIAKDLKYKGINDTKLAEKLLRRFSDVDRVLMVFDPKFDPTRDSSITLYDKIEASPLDIKIQKISDLDIPADFRNSLLSRGINELTPVQSIAIEKGLLSGKNFLIMSETASGKTLIGEISYFSRFKKGNKLLYLSPLVSLALQKYEDFKDNYPNFKISLRVGLSRIADNPKDINRSLDSDIIIGTYEGIDQIFRSGMTIEKISTVVIDEIHMLQDKERGPLLDCLISRLYVLCPDSQFIALSATVGNPKELSETLDMELVIYNKRPVPLERHVIFCSGHGGKLYTISRIIRKENSDISSKGYKGQAIVFSNSRKNCHSLAEHFKTRGINAAAYHSGLPFNERREIETKFWKGKIDTVVTTAALAAGVDFPASAVIFETLSMGIEPLKIFEFQQMIGRAGRPSFHDKGKAYLLIDPQEKYGEVSEEEHCFYLLENISEKVDIQYDNDTSLERTLSIISTFSTLSAAEIKKYFEMGFAPIFDNDYINILRKDGLIEFKGDNLNITKFGRIVSSNFLKISHALFIKNFRGKDVREIIFETLPFPNTYLTSKLQAILKIDSSSLFSGTTLEKIYFHNRKEALSKHGEEILINLLAEFFACDCKDAPYCNCPKIEIGKRLLDLRKAKLSPNRISEEFRKEYGLKIFSADLINWLDSAIRTLETTEKLFALFGKEEYRMATLKEIENIVGKKYMD
ncbi:MAG: DEAD/DEAH box helicase [Candidatus Methanofastidiosa archaeon]|nr:DEAD/DEAH box helicase [Candidatus Methanofastidiosa archaeon]